MARLSDICLKIGSGATPTGGKSAYLMKGISLIRSQNVLDISFAEDGLAYISDEQARKLQNVEILEGDILLNITGDSVARVCIVPNHILPARVNQHVAIIRVDKTKADNNYILYSLIKSKKTLLALASAGSTRNALTKKMIEEFEVFLPSLAEQKRIASILSSLDDKIAVNRRINANLEAQAQALFKSWFVDFTPFKDQPFVDSELGPIPQGWKVGKLTDIAVYLNGLAMQKFPPQDIKDSFPVLKIKELGAGICDNSSDRCSNKVPKKYIIEDGDIIFSWSGTLMVDVWCGGQCGLNQHLFKVSSSNYPKWFYYHWTKKHLRDFIHIARDKAVTMGHIKRGHLDNALVVVPNNFILEKATHLFEPLLNMVISKRIENQRLAALRDTLLPKLMSGEIKL